MPISEVLHRKYRPNSFSQFVGNLTIINIIKNSIKHNSIPNGYIFCGWYGIGKTSLARIIARVFRCINLKDHYEPCLKCKECFSNGNIIELDGASNRGIDEIRYLKEHIYYISYVGNKKFYVIDEAHMLTKEALNSLLKILEEPPIHVCFILVTTEIEKLMDTVISRCQVFNFAPLSNKEIFEVLKFVVNKEKIKINEEAIDLISNYSQGSVRNGLVALEKLFMYCNYNIDAKCVQRVLGFVEKDLILKYISMLKNENNIFKLIDDLYLNGVNIFIFFKTLANWFKNNKHHNALKLIDIIYSSLSELRFEGDVRMIGYILSYRLSKFI